MLRHKSSKLLSHYISVISKYMVPKRYLLLEEGDLYILSLESISYPKGYQYHSLRTAALKY
jgi:hypothetical protein